MPTAKIRQKIMASTEPMASRTGLERVRLSHHTTITGTATTAHSSPMRKASSIWVEMAV